MDRLSNHSDLEELLGAYAIDALEPDEAEAVERHLADCPRCRAEVAAHHEVASLLGYTGGPAPAGLWDRIAENLEEPPPPLRLRAVDAPPAAPPPPRRRGLPTPLIGALAAAAIVIAVLGAEVVRLNNRTNHLLPPRTTSAIEAAAFAAAVQGDARHATLRSSDGKLTVETVVLPDGTGFVLKNNLPSLSKALTYQLWGMRAGDRVSLGILGTQPQISMFRVEGGVDGLAVTEERTGGVVTTNNDPVVFSRI